MDKLVDAARARGLNVLVMVAETPSWANGNKANNIPPLDMAYFGSYAKAMAYHFAGRVQAWEVRNEPNATWSWNGTVSQYVMMLQSGYRGFKAGDPKALVVLGGISGNNATWLKSAYSAGARGSFDVVATHPYPSPSDSPPEADPSGTPASIPSVRNIEAVLSAHSDSSIPIWFTEFGWSAHANTGSEPATQRGVTPQQQADYLVRALQLIRANYPYVTNAFWYNERDTSTGNVHEDNFGLVQSDLTPTPAYFAAQSYLTTP
jgi:hypothetical protein